MGFLKGTNTFEVGKLKLGSTNIDRIYFGSNYVWPPVPTENSCSIEGITLGAYSLDTCSIEGVASATYSFASCSIEGNAVINN